MMRRVAAVAVVVALSFVAIPTAAVAQVASFQNLSSLVEPGVEVVVVDTAGIGRTGDVAGVSASSLSLLIDGTRHDFDEADVVQVVRPAHGLSRGIGAQIGGVAGAVGAILIMRSCIGGEEGCPGELSSLNNNEMAGLIGGLIVGGAVGGALLTHRTPEQVLFQSGGPGSTVAFRLSPILSRRAKGALFSMTW